MVKKLLLFGVCSALVKFGAAQLSATYNFTGGIQTFTVPCGVNTVHIQAWGAQGGSGSGGASGSAGGSGGLGGYSEGDLFVTPGSVLNIFVGGQGATPTGGFNGGANGGSQNAGGGGGFTDIRLNGTSDGNRVLVAGGGGGGGRGGCESSPNINGGNGGNGGGGVGANGADAPTSGGSAGGGFGGNAGSVQGAFGAKGIGCSGFLGSDGATATTSTGGVGGAGQSCCCFSFGSIPGGGGGGGGYVGGGGGGGGSAGTTGCSGNDKGGGGGGGGGSSYIGGVTNGVVNSGIWLGDGMAIITWNYTPPAQPTFTTNPPAVCQGSTTTYTIATDANANSYNWIATGDISIISGNGSTSVQVAANNAGNGTLSVVAQGSCDTSAPAILNVTVNALPNVVANTSAAAVCTGNSVTLSGSGAATYSWDNGVSDNTPFVPASTQTYSVTGTDANSCSATASTTVTVNTLPTVGATASSSAVCAGASVTLSGTGATTYSWDNSVTDGVAFVPAATIPYTVTGTDANGCSNTASVTVTVNPLPTFAVNVQPGSAVCQGEQVTITAAGNAVTYVWSDGITNAVAFTSTATNTYSVTATDANGCESTGTTTLTVYTLPNVTANATSAAVCTGGQVTLTGAGATSYTWDNSVVDNTAFTPASTQTYTVTGTDANGCSATASITVTVNTLPTVGASASSAAICAGASVTLSGTGATTYSWDNNVTDGVSFSPAATATYSVTGTDANNCSNTATVSVTVNAVPTVSATISPNDTVCIGQSVTVTATGASTYAWSGGVSNGVAFTSTTDATYTVTATGANGCTATTSVDLTVDECLGVDNLKNNPGNIKVFPNPSAGMFVVHARKEIATINVYSQKGEIVYQNTVGNNQQRIDLTQQAAGVYLLEVVQANNVKSYIKLVKE